MAELRGLTWAHTRGFAPLAALGRVWEDFHPGERVTWTARSLWSFGEEPLAGYLDDYDLFVFDYPFAGEALERDWVLPLESLLPRADLDACRNGTIGPLYDAFGYDGRQAALPLDVATHVSASRADLLDSLGEALPADWSQTIALARRTGKVAMPLRPTGVWGAFLSLCSNAGDTPFRHADGRAFDREIAERVLDGIVALVRHVEPWCFETYPVALLNRMANGDDIAFVPLTYGYCTYGLRGYGQNRLSFHDLANGAGHGRGAILGGAGIGVSSRSRHPHLAARHAAWLASSEIQSSLYVAFGGQPAQRQGWLDPLNDQLSNGFFSATRDSAEHAYVRPNQPGFHGFQNFAAGRLHQAVTRAEASGPALADVASAWAALRAGLAA
ncbi:extracellular solute-binding protein [Bosea thiooxidans]